MNLQNELAKQLENIINQRVIELTRNEHDWKESYQTVNIIIDNEIESVKSVIADYKEQNLTFNSIEQEGYLRAMLVVKSILTENKPSE